MDNFYLTTTEFYVEPGTIVSYHDHKTNFYVTNKDRVHCLYDDGSVYLVVLELPTDDPDFSVIQTISKSTKLVNKIYVREVHKLSEPETYQKFGIKMPDLEISCGYGYLEVVKQLVIDGANVNEKDGIALMKAAYYGYKDIAMYLIENGADIKMDNQNSFRTCVTNNVVNIAKLLIDNGVDVNLERYIVRACKYGYIEMAELLVNSGADISIFDDDIMSLIAKNQHWHIMKFLVEKGIDSTEDYEYTIHNCAQAGNLETVKIFLEMGTYDIKVKNDILDVACYYGHFEIAEYIIKMGADIQHDENYPLARALEFGHLEVAKYLINNGADIHTIKDKVLLKALMREKLSSVVYLVENGADIHILDNDNYLCNTLKISNITVTKYLHQHGVDLHSGKEKPLIIAATDGRLDVVKFLVEDGADIHAHNDKAVRNAARFGRLNVVQYLDSVGANIYAENNYALRYSAGNGYLAIVDYLVGRGADINDKKDNAANEGNDSALVLCTKNGKHRVVEYLLKHGANVGYEQAIKNATEYNNQFTLKLLVEHFGTEGEEIAEQYKDLLGSKVQPNEDEDE